MGKRPHMDILQVGDQDQFSKTVSEYDIYAFAGIVGDFYGVHLNEEHAKKTRFEKRIAQGALSIGFLSTVMGYMAGRVPEPGAVSYHYDVKFTAPVYIGDTVTAKLELIEKQEEKNVCVFKASVTNQQGDVVAEGKTFLKVL